MHLKWLLSSTQNDTLNYVDAFWSILDCPDQTDWIVRVYGNNFDDVNWHYKYN
jgi:hypothetical protein